MEYKGNKGLLIEYKKLLLEEGKTQTYIANALGMTRQAFASYTKKEHFTFDDLQRLLAPLGYSLAYDFIKSDDTDHNNDNI